MVDYLNQYTMHNFDDFLDSMYDRFISDVGDVNMLQDTVKFTGVMKRFLKSSTLEVLIQKSCSDMKTSMTNIIAICDTDWMNVEREYINSKLFYKMILSNIDRIKRMFPVLIKKFKCTFAGIIGFLRSSEGMMVKLELDMDYQKLKSGVSLQKIKTVMLENGLQYVYNEVLTRNEVQKLLIL